MNKAGVFRCVILLSLLLHVVWAFVVVTMQPKFLVIGLSFISRLSQYAIQANNITNLGLRTSSHKVHLRGFSAMLVDHLSYHKNWIKALSPPVVLIDIDSNDLDKFLGLKCAVEHPWR